MRRIPNAGQREGAFQCVPFGYLCSCYHQKSTNGVIWYILGVLWVLAFYPLDVAVVSILMCVLCRELSIVDIPTLIFTFVPSLSWADTAASTIGRMWGRYTPRLPARLPVLGLPFAPRKSLAGFIAGSVTGALITAGFWGWLGPLGSAAPVWSWESGVAGTGVLSGGLGLSMIGLVGGLIAGVSEALGTSLHFIFTSWCLLTRLVDVGSLDDNLTLPIVSGGCLLGFFKLIQWYFT